MFLRQFKQVLDEYDFRNQQNPPFLTLHIELLEQFEGSRTFTNFIEPLLPKNRTGQPWLYQSCIPPAKKESAITRPCIW